MASTSRRPPSFGHPPRLRSSSGEIQPIREEPENESKGVTFYGSYETVSGVPTHVILPSRDENFTCHAFSHDGSRFVTGETDGSLRVCNTSSYECIAAGERLMRRAVSAVNFARHDRNKLIAVDEEGNLLEFMMKLTSTDDVSGAPYMYRIEKLHERHLSLGIATRACRFRSLTYQFSEEGDVLARVLHHDARHDPRLAGTTVILTKTHPSTTRNMVVSFETTNIGLPVLSKNGRGLLACFFREDDSATENDSRELRSASEIVVIPHLDFEDDNQRRIQLEGDRANWGLRGEYLLVWDYDCGRPRLSVYRTADLYNHGNSATPLGQRKLSHSLSNWKAQMLVQHNPSANIEVLICEVNHGNRRLLVWSLEDNLDIREISIRLPQEIQSSMKQLLLRSRSANRVLEFEQPPKSNDEHLSLIVDDVFPKFCASSNEKWIGVISCCRRSGALSSLQTGATTWSFSSLEPEPTNPFFAPNHIKFDPHERHLLVFGDNCIHAFAPAFLDNSLESGHEIRELKQGLTAINSVIERRRLLDAYQYLPSKALARTWQLKTRGKQRLLWFEKSRRHREHKLERKHVQYIDASLSPSGDILALIGQRPDGTRFVCTRDAKAGEARRWDEFGSLNFPAAIDARDEEFLPERVFLYPDVDGSERMVLLETGRDPYALFCDVLQENWSVTRLGMKTCISICRGRNLDKIALLEEDGVCILDLALQNVVDEIPFNVDFGRLMSMIKESMLWSNADTEGHETNAANRISDDGTAVLLAWDMKNKKSIVVTPVTEQQHCEAMITRAEGMLSDFCALCANGACTAYVDVEDIKKGRITIGFFHEIDQRTVHQVQIDPRVPKNIPDHELRRLLPRIFYELSPDGTQLFTRIIELRSSNSRAIIVKDQVKVFGVYAVVDCIPNYDLLNLRRTTSVEQSLEQLHNRHGFSVFNTPSLSGMTIFQKAFVMKNREMVDQIKHLAEETGSELSLEWEIPSKGSSNILKSSLDSRSTNDIKDAVELVCSKLVPFRSAAVILKESFQQLASEYRGILEQALSRNIVAYEACRVRVHVDYLSTKFRRDCGIHIHTADSCLEWSLTTEPNELESMWKEKHKEAKYLEESSGNRSTKEASLKFVQIEDAAKTGMDGIIRPLLLHKVPEHFFKFPAVKWIVTYKWIKIWQGRFLRQAMFYALFVAFFTAYIILLSRSANLTEISTARKVVVTLILGITFCFAIQMALEEYRQIATYLRDGQDHFGNRWKGLRHFVGFQWNLLDLLSCLLLLFAIPLFHTLALFHVHCDKVLSAFVAWEAILASAKVWYFAQPFRVSGALVRMIGNIVNDCLAFLLLGSVILFGFSLALHVLFRHTPTEGEEGQMVQDAFGTFGMSLLTLFYALLGDFDQEIYLAAGDLSWLVALTFIAYTLTQLIVLLNLLISIMGDTFDRVKSTEEAQLLVGQAQFIDSCEAGLTQSEQTKINKEIGKYLYVLTKTEEEENKKPSAQWKGKLKTIETNCRKAIESVERNIKTALRQNIDAIVEQTKSLVRAQGQTVFQRTNQLVQGQDTRIAALATRLDEHSRVLAERIDSLESRLEESNERIAAQLEAILSHVER